MFYFSYGSNINLDHLTEYLDTHDVTLDTESPGQHALLHDYRLRTNYFAGSHGAGVATTDESLACISADCGFADRVLLV